MRNTSGLKRGGQPGRRKGVPNKSTAEIRDVARRLFDADYWDQLKQRLDRGKLAPALEIRLLAYLYGEPKQTVDVPGVVDAITLLAQKVTHELHPGPTADRHGNGLEAGYVWDEHGAGRRKKLGPADGLARPNRGLSDR